MSERYTRLFSLPENLGLDGCPVLISAGALLKDNNTEKMLVQLKLRNISEQVIKSVKVKINAYDTTGASLKGVDDFSYLDLAVERDGEFGSKTPIVLPDKTTRSFSLEILSVVYGHGNIYQSGNNAVASSIDSKTLEKLQILNHERKEKKQLKIAFQQEKRQRTLKYVAFLPFIMYVFAIILGFSSRYWILRHYGRYWKAFLPALIVPCMCLLSSRAKHNQIKFLKITLSISVAFIFIQFLANMYYNSGARLISYFPGHGMFLLEFYDFIDESIGGCHLLFLLKRGVLRLFKDKTGRIVLVFSDVFFLLKNISAILITILQIKEGKKQVAERMESK